MDALIGALSDPFDCLRVHAILALARIGDRRTVDPLIRAPHDEDVNVRSVDDSYLREAFKIKYDPDTGRARPCLGLTLNKI